MMVFVIFLTSKSNSTERKNMENRKTKNAVSLETFVFLVLFGVGAAAIGMTMGGRKYDENPDGNSV